MSDSAYDAILVVSFGGPEKRDDVIPFLENVLRGKPVPRERLLEVAEHYYHFDGVSPINQQCRDLIDALRQELDAHEIRLPIYWGNRNWNPMLPDVVRQMAADGIKHPLAYVTSAFSSYSGCRQYRENILDAVSQLPPPSMTIDKLRAFYNHPDFIAVTSQHVAQAIHSLNTNSGAEPVTDVIAATAAADVYVAFTAHSIPFTMSSTSDYEKQLTESCRLVASELQLADHQWRLVYQSRSGRPQDPWLEPDICDFLETLSADGVRNVVIAPIGFLSDHMEVLYDLDDEARKACDRLNIRMARAATPGHHPRFVSMLRQLIQERLQSAPRQCVGQFGPNHDVCPIDCCPAPQRPNATRPV